LQGSRKFFVSGLICFGKWLLIVALLLFLDEKKQKSRAAEKKAKNLWSRSINFLHAIFSEAHTSTQFAE